MPPLPAFPSIGFIRIKLPQSPMSFTAGDNFLLSLFPFDPSKLSQYWFTRRQPDQTLKIINRATGNVVDAQWGISVAALIQQWWDKTNRPDSDLTNQRWRPREAPVDPNHPDEQPLYVYSDDNQYVWSVASDEEGTRGHYVPATQAEPGTAVLLEPLGPGNPNDYSNSDENSPFYEGQTWLFDTDIPPALQVVQIASLDPRSVDDQKNPLVLDVFGFQRSPGFVQLYQNNGGFNQHWSLVPNAADPSFSIQSVCSGQGVGDPQNPDGQAILSDADLGDPQQKWSIQWAGDTDANGNPIVAIVSQVDGLFLDALGGGPLTRVQTRKGSGAASQRWALVPWAG